MTDRIEITRAMMEAARFAFADQGLVFVPAEPTHAMLYTIDDDGDRIWDGGTEDFFRNEEEALWYARQVWAAMVCGASPSD